jgi:hypothetical protein
MMRGGPSMTMAKWKSEKWKVERWTKTCFINNDGLEAGWKEGALMEPTERSKSERERIEMWRDVKREKKKEEKTGKAKTKTKKRRRIRKRRRKNNNKSMAE